MSRIHEALKRAQEERTTQQGGQLAPASVATAEPGSGAGVDGMAALAETIAPSFVSPLSPQSLVANCRQNEWSPERGLLFQSNDDNHLGKEVFRTLRTRLYQVSGMQPLKTLLITSSM